MPTSRSRADQISALFDAENAHLARLVARRAKVDEAILEDACTHAWMQLVRHPDLNLAGESRHQIIGWLTTTAVREAWRLDTLQRRIVGVGEPELVAASIGTGWSCPAAEDIALLRERLDLVRELPERPRRFLLRLMLGYSYHEIAAAENVNYRIVNRQVARAKRLLRALDEDYRA